MFGYQPPYAPSHQFGGLYPGGFNSQHQQQYPSYGGFQPMGPYQGVPPSHLYQQQGFGAGSYPGASQFGQYPNQYPQNGPYGGAAGQSPYYPSNPTSPSFPTNSFNPSYGSQHYPSNNGYNNNYNPSVQNGFYNPTTSAVTSPQNSYRPSGLIPDPFGSVAPVIGTPSYNPASNTGSLYNPSQTSSSYNPSQTSSSYNPSQTSSSYNPSHQTSPQYNQYKPITIIDTPSYSSPSYQQGSSSAYKPGSGSSGSQEGYDSVVVTAQGMAPYDQSSSYKPSSGNYKPVVSSPTYYKPPSSSSYRPPSPSYSQQNSYRPLTVQGSIQEIPSNTPTYYPSNSQNRPSFYSASSSDRVSFPSE